MSMPESAAPSVGADNPPSRDQSELPIEVTTGSGNVFRDLGFADPEAELAKADARIAREDAEAAAAIDDGWEWAVVEIMGHRRHAGRVREEERFGAKLLRIDIPNKGDPDAHGWTTHYYPGSALFSFSPAERDAVLRINRPHAAPARLSFSGPDGAFDDEEVF